MARLHSLQAASVILALASTPLQWSSAFKTQRAAENLFSNDFNTPPGLVELMWASDYFDITGTPAEDSSIEFMFDSVIDGIVMTKELDYELSPTNRCAALNMKVELPESEHLLTVTSFNNPDKCQELCSRTALCKASQFNRNTGTCVLLKSLTAQLERAPGAAIQLPTCKTDCFHEGKKLTGGGSSLGKVPNANFCQALCASSSECKGFTYRRSSQECLSFPDDTDLTGDADAVSGSKDGCPHFAAMEDTSVCFAAGKSSAKLTGLSTITNIDTVEQCLLQCQSVANCKTFTFNASERRCYLKSKAGQLVAGTAHETSGTRFCDSSCLLKDVAIRGQALRTISSSAGPHFCHGDCAAESRCAVWSFNAKTSECSLFEKSDNLRAKLTTGAWTGPATPCAIDALYRLEAKACFLRGEKFGYEEPYAVSQEASPAACQLLCQRSSMCEAFTYEVNKKQCGLLLAFAESQRTVDPAYVSGPRWCSTVSINMEYKGTAIAEISAAFKTPEECQLRCQGTEGCTHWGFYPKQKSCKLLGSTTTSSSVVGVTSGTKYYDGSCDLFVYSLYKLGYSRVLGGNINTCRKDCRKDPKCKGFTNGGGCYIFDQFAFSKVRHLKTGQTGWPECSTCFREGVGYSLDSSALIATVESQNAEECRQRCEFYEYCTRFTYNAKTNTCSLLSGETADQAGQNLVSGPVSCKPAETSCIQSNTIYANGKTIKQLVANTSEECMELCAKTPGCLVYTHNSTTKACELLGGEGLVSQTKNGFTAAKKRCVTYGSDLCGEQNVGFDGGNIFPNAISCDSAQCCRDKCLNEPTCGVFSYNTSTKQCWIKVLKSYKTRVAAPNTISSSRTGCPFCARWKLAYSGKTVASRNTPTQTQCQLECQLLDRCNFFTFGPGSSCTLYENEGTLKEHSGDVWSGPKYC